ncbi:hypothetical protein CfE428DRAFT_5618 [Chthoniobacter flavus Ellin428]|uniref:Uncharacterized protein n=1 Tax=Chthoniobacter flavus Ellin428 TaxID=497964 RepID=B4D9M8_9BACT|nr:hypothetical protein [Chthoniobacter flavus]EDY16809.1 hypothetical protein CfE428DRAFT_5618 [Chthoniobacter flavus Ellin428]TCO93366.1 hypothetical protein EV701_10470 [Chthoniobacter flavus]
MAIPTKAQWAGLKSGAGIEKSAWWKPADAAVGPALGKLDTAKAAWKSKKDLDNVRNYLGALSKVHEAFEKFLKKKDLSAAGPLKTQIEGWINEVATKHEKLKAKVPALKAENKKELEDILTTF